MTTQIGLRRELKCILLSAWTVTLNGADVGTVIRTKEGWPAVRGTGWDAKPLGTFTTKLSAMHAVLGRGVKP